MRPPNAPACFLAICFSPWLVGQSLLAGHQQETANAAVKYLRADAALRQSYALPPDATARLEKMLELPLDGEDEKLVAAAEEALVEFHHGAALTRCDWTMSVEDGPLANTAHRGAIRELAAVAALRARLRFRDGDPAGAAADLSAAIAAARHLSVDGSIASVLFGYKLENSLTGILARNLYRLSSAQLHELANGLVGLPGGYSIGTALALEKLGRNDLLAVVPGITSRDGLVEQLVSKIPALRSSRALAAEVVDGCGASVEGFVSCVNQQQSFYGSWAARFELPPEQFERAYKNEIEDAAKANPVIRTFTPNLPRFRWADAYSGTRRALLLAAIAVRLDGPKALSQQLDPYDRNPFSIVPIDGGFRLESRLREAGDPVSISVSAEGLK